MKTSLHKILDECRRVRCATDAGTAMHERLGRIVIDGDRVISGDAQLAANIIARPEIASFFGPRSRREFPVSAWIRGRFVSRRLDRVCIDTAAKTVRILDYKTDVDQVALRPKYIAQLREYVAIMRKIYPDFTVSAHILWTHDWALERIE